MFRSRPRYLQPSHSLSSPIGSQKLIIFVHGIFGDPTQTWVNRSGQSWADLMKADTDFRDFTIATYRFDTPIRGRTSGIEEVSTRLLRQLEDELILKKFTEIYFITHSMGGLIVKRALTSLNRPIHIEKLRRVKAVMYISTPALGADIASIGSYLSVNPQLRDMRDADLNSFIQSLENQWQDLLRDRDAEFELFPQSFCAYEKKPTYGIMVVNRVYATTRCDENPFPVDENHEGIVKPSSNDADIYKWAKARIQQTSTRVHATPRNAPRSPATSSEVRLVIGRLANPVFWIFNPSSVAAQQPKYQFNLWNLDLPDPSPTPDRPRLILRIPVRLMQDYILTGNALGPWRLLDLSPFSGEIQHGHVIFGTASVQCLNCERIRHYWIYLKIGESGWIAEVPMSN